MTNTEQIRTKKISFILALSVIIFAVIATYFTLCHDINIIRITTPVILGLAMYGGKNQMYKRRAVKER